MKTSASPGAIAPATLRLSRRATPGAPGFAGRIRRALLRAWLRYRLDACTRCLHTIAAQRANDFQAERLLHREISAMRTLLRSL